MSPGPNPRPNAASWSSPSPKKRLCTSLLDRQVDLALKISKHIHSLSLAQSALMENIVVMGEPNVSRARKKQAFNNSLKCSHIIGQFSDSLIKEAKSVAPFGCLSCAQKRMETHQKQQLAAGSSVKQLSPMQQLEAIDKENVPPTPKQIKGKSTAGPNKRKTLTGMEFPTPKRDKHFTRVEFAQLLASHPEKAQ